MTELEVILKKINEHEISMTAALTRGGCKDFGEYQRICGVIHGLGLAKLDIADLRKKIKDYEDE
jgi:hypothetical protein